MECETCNEYRVEDEADRRVVRCRGELCMATAACLRDALLAALEARSRTVVDLSEATEVDLSGLQLLCSAHRTFTGRDLKLEVRAAPAEFVQAARAGGFDALQSVCSNRNGDCLWKA